MTNTRRRTFHAVIVILLAFIAVCASPVRAAGPGAESAQDYVQPFISRMQYQTLLDALGLDRDQKAIAEALYSDYAMLIEAGVEDAERQASAAGKDTVAAVLSGKQRATAIELRQMRSDVVKAYTSVWDTADIAMEHLLSGATAFLTSSQAAQAEPKLRDLRRAIHLAPLRDMRYSSDYAGEGVCLLDLVAEAQQPGGELTNVPRAPLASLLEQYEAALDGVILAEADDMRAAPVQKRIADIQRDDAAARNAQARMLQPWQQMYQLNRRTTGAIAQLITNPVEKQNWLDRFDRACFPWLLEEDKIDQQMNWLNKQSIDGEAWAGLQNAYETYRAERRVLAQSMIEMIVNARLTMALALHPMMDPTAVPGEASGVYADMIKLTGRQKAVATTMNDVIRISLNESQRKAMNRAIR